MHQLSSFKQASIILLLSFVCSSTAVLANGFSFSTATDFTTGNYGGTKSTDIWYIPFTARYDKDRASFRVIVPYLNITGPGNVLGPGIGGLDGSGIIGGGGFIGGGGVIVCDEANNNCAGRAPARSGSNSGSGGNSGSGSNSGSSGNSGSGNNSGSGGNSGPGNNSGSGGSSGSGNSGDGSSDDNGGNSGSGSGSGSGSDDNGSNSGNGSNGNGDGSGDVNQSRQNKISTLGLVGGIPLGDGGALTRSTQSGLGDIITAFSYNLIDHAPSGIAFDITTRLKIPTASAQQNLGTGQVDYAIQGDLFKTISQFTLSATFGYRILGNPSGITFHNVMYGAASVGYRLSPSVTLGTSYNMGQSPIRLQDSRDLTLYLSQRVSDNFRLNIYGLKGFSERSPDWGGGINIRYVF